MEQAVVLISIVLGIAITFELENLNKLLRSKKVSWHWAQCIFAFFVLMTNLVFWWMMAGQIDDRGQISLGEFLPIMGLLIILVLASAVALPDTAQEKHVDMAGYYLENRRYQWGLMLLLVALIGGSWLATLYLRHGFWHMIVHGWGEYVPMMCIAFMIYAKRWWQVALGYAALSFVPIAWLSRTI